MNTRRMILVSFLLILFAFGSIEAAPKICGPRLINTLKRVCSTSSSEETPCLDDTPIQDKPIATKCCLKGCTEANMKEFCC
uniref:Insulin-like domain-containing protein n=1 Tax=Plectus sambesii TaxID=2011161 RepID=A0A914VX84_9BILA